MISIGLTGSIGMGKSTVAKMFARFGVAVWNADDAVHRLYALGGAGVELIQAVFPSAVVDGAVDRNKLASFVLGVPENLKRLEGIIHPLVAKDRMAFIEKAGEVGAEFILLDIPLLFEGAAEDQFDVVVVVSASAKIQKQRVLARPGMSEEKFDAILKTQLADEEKRKRADFVIDTDQPLANTLSEVEAVMYEIKNNLKKKTSHS